LLIRNYFFGITVALLQMGMLDSSHGQRIGTPQFGKEYRYLGMRTKRDHSSESIEIFNALGIYHLTFYEA